jgi:transposase
MPRSKKGQAISLERRSPRELKALRALLDEAKRRKDLETWRRAKAVLGYVGGIAVIALSEKLDVTRGSINRWLQWFNAAGADGLRPKPQPGGVPRLSTDQHDELAALIEAGPQAAGFSTGMWTGPMIGELIRRRYGVSYHNHHIPRMLHRLGFSVQRPRKRLARADREKQAIWLKKKFPAIKKKPLNAAASSSLATRSASGSTEHSTAPGLASATSLASTPLECEKPRTSLEP